MQAPGGVYILPLEAGQDKAANVPAVAQGGGRSGLTVGGVTTPLDMAEKTRPPIVAARPPNDRVVPSTMTVFGSLPCLAECDWPPAVTAA